ncbi:hypothetical protein APED_32540 [Acanthopleuribacter pedis]
MISAQIKRLWNNRLLWVHGGSRRADAEGVGHRTINCNARLIIPANIQWHRDHPRQQSQRRIAPIQAWHPRLIRYDSYLVVTSTRRAAKNGDA